MDRLALLKENSTFSFLPAPELERIAGMATVEERAAGSLVLFSEALLRGAPPAALAAGGGDALLGGIALFLAVMFYRGGEASR